MDRGLWFPQNPALDGGDATTDLRRVARPYHFRVRARGRIYEVAIAAGFVFDGASIPRFFWRVVGYPFEPDLVGPALCHDAMYAAELFFNHAMCDSIFRALLRQNFSRVATALAYRRKRGRAWRWTVGATLAARAWIIWLAVRLFGGLVWRRHTTATVEAARKFISAGVVKLGRDGKPRRVILY